MKLRNKNTGEIVECAIIPIIDGYVNEYKVFEKGESIAELNEEWEDYEEPKKYWFIDADFGVCGDKHIGEPPKYKYEIGNYFETKEEAERAVEKLKAWKRLKDKGFRFKTWGWERKIEKEYCIWFTIDNDEKCSDDLDLLFGGEE